MTLGRLCAPNSAWARAEGAPVQHRTPAVSLQRRWQAQEAAAAAPRARWPGPAVRHRCARAPEAAQLGGNAEAAAGSGVPEPGSAEVAASVEQAEVLRSRRLITEQQQLLLESHAQPYELTKTRRIVETAMLAAVTGLAYSLATLLKVQAYLGYFLPLPVIMSALRSGAAAGVKTATTAFMLLFILMGPVNAFTYILIYGTLSLALGCCWAARLPWAFCIPAAAVARVGSYLAYVKMASWMTKEDLMALIVSNVHALIDQLSSTLGHSGAPSLLAVGTVLGSLLLVNSLIYVGMLHVVYSIMLRGMGLEMSPMPAAVQRFVYRGQAPPAPAAGGGAGDAGA